MGFKVSRPAPGWRRRAPWLLVAVSTLTLPLAWYWWSAERVSARQLQQMRQRESVMAPLQSQVRSHVANWTAAQAQVAALQDKIRAVGEMPEQWQGRTLTIENQRMSRVEAEQYLRDLVNNENSLFVPSTVLLKAAKANESIFSTHQGQDGPEALIVSIKADLFTRNKP